MLGIVLSVSRRFRLYAVLPDWRPGQAVGAAVSLNDHPLAVNNYVVLDEGQIIFDFAMPWLIVGVGRWAPNPRYRPDRRKIHL